MADRSLTANDNPCLSVIIPVYNVERYLGRCVDSLLNTQGIENTEIILIDDGSTDESGRIADSYAEKHAVISCYHKENGGLSDARNYGLNCAKGRYVFFCDSDDMVVPGKFCKVIEALAKSDADVLLWDGMTIGEDDSVSDAGYGIILVHSGLEEGREITGTEAMVSQIKDHKKVAMTAWLRAVRRDYLLENKLFFEAGIYHEDELWTPQIMAGASKVQYLKEKVYCYRVRENSIMSSPAGIQKKHAEDLVCVMDKLHGYYRDKITDRKARKILMSDWAETYLWAIKTYEAGKHDLRRDIPRARIFSAAGTLRSKMKGLLLLLFGVKAYCKLAG